MSSRAHTPEERAHLLASVGAPPEAIEQAAEQEQQPASPKRKKREPVSTSLEQDQDAVVADIVARAGVDREAALKLVDEHVQRVFDANKVSKLEAAARGIVSTDHNKALWTSVQNLRTALKVKVRAHYKGTIAAKVRKTSAQAQENDDAEFQAFIASDALATAFEAWKEAQKQGS